MGPYVIAAICAVGFVLVALAIYFGLKKTERPKHSNNQEVKADQEGKALIKEQGATPATISETELSVKFEDLPALTEEQETQLAEISDNKLLAALDETIPGLQTLVDATKAIKYLKKAKAVKKTLKKSKGKLYRVTIPNGEKLADSRSVEGAVRGFYHGSDGKIKGHVNLESVDVEGVLKESDKLAVKNIVSSAMNVASMVVGQYYMAEINAHLDAITNGIDKIAEFQPAICIFLDWRNIMMDCFFAFLLRKTHLN